MLSERTIHKVKSEAKLQNGNTFITQMPRALSPIYTKTEELYITELPEISSWNTKITTNILFDKYSKRATLFSPQKDMNYKFYDYNTSDFSPKAKQFT